MSGHRKPQIVILQKTNQNNLGTHYRCSKCGITLSWGAQVVSRHAVSRKYYHVICAKELGLIDD